MYKAVVQNTAACAADTSAGATVTVDQKSVGGSISPTNSAFCDGQNVADILTLTGNTGSVINWQSSLDSTNWNDFNPAVTDSSYGANGVSVSTQYRVIVKNGVCVADTSAVAFIRLYPTPFPQATISPADTTICFGSSAQLSALISIGTNYSWSNYDSAANPANGDVGMTPFAINASVSPAKTTGYILGIQNTGCPNILADTFQVNVIPLFTVNAGNDTSIVINQPLQLQAISSDTSTDSYLWSPPTGLNNPAVSNPVATLGLSVDSIRYMVKATDAFGCYAEDNILVRVFKTAPDIFVPNAFTPGKNVNSVFRPIPVGISSLQFFKVYNRWGQLVYSTSRIGDGWDGNFGGKPQGTGSFVWMVQGTTYTGKTIFRKGTMTLVR